jgi:CheR methyltransferase, SAM binding domain
VLTAAALVAAPAQGPGARSITWQDLPTAIQERLQHDGLSEHGFADWRDQLAALTANRVREGDLDALVYYGLQSTAFTRAAPIEPALSARALVQALDADERRAYLDGGDLAMARVPPAARTRLASLVEALPSAPPATRLAAFRAVVDAAVPNASDREAFVLGHYLRAMRFLYKKEFGAARPEDAASIAVLYQTRGISTDTSVEAGYLVALGLATLHALEPARQIRQVLIVGPGLDLAPRTGLLEAGPPETYQPYAVIDALLARGLARLEDLVVVGGDVNPRVVAHLEASRENRVELTLVSGIGDGGGVTLLDDYRQYFAALGTAVGETQPAPVLPDRYRGHLRKTLRVRAAVSAAVRGARLDVATERLGENRFDLIVATNVLPYLDDAQLALAMSNMAAMLAPGGVLLHNEARGILDLLSGDVGLPIIQARSAPIASVAGAPPLADRVFLHEKPVR